MHPIMSDTEPNEASELTAQRNKLRMLNPADKRIPSLCKKIATEPCYSTFFY